MNRQDYEPERPNGAAVAAGVIVAGIGFGLIILAVYVIGAGIAQAVMGA